MPLWTDAASVREHLGDAQNAKGYVDADIDKQITKSENYLRPYFAAALDNATVAGWTTIALTPTSVHALTAMLAAAKVLESFGGQSLEDEPSKAGSLWTQVSRALTAIQNGSFEVVDTAGNAVAGALVLPASTTRGKTPTFSMGNEGDGSEGSLDDF